MEQQSITIGGEMFRLTYNYKTSVPLIENHRPGRSILELLDSRRHDDRILLLVAGLDEVHEKDKRQQLTNTTVQRISERMRELVEVDREAGAELDEVFLPVQRAIGESGIAGRIFTYQFPYGPVAVGKEQGPVVPS